jgi:hypothetical protein
VARENQNFELFAGDDAILRVTVTDEDGDALDITGMTVDWALVRKVGDTPILTKETGGGGITLTTPASGILDIALTDANTSDLSGNYWHQVVLTDGSGNISTVTIGQGRFRRRAALS